MSPGIKRRINPVLKIEFVSESPMQIRIVYQDDTVIKRGLFNFRHNRFLIQSRTNPQITNGTLYVNGSSRGHDGLTIDSTGFPTKEVIIEAVKALNKQYGYPGQAIKHPLP